MIADAEELMGSTGWSLPSVHAHLANKTSRTWLLIVEDTPVAHLLTAQVEQEAEILTIAVHAAHRRAGHATALLKWAEASWLDQGVHHAYLEVRVDNPAARALYASRGWQEAGRRPSYYRDGTDALLLRWDAPC